MHAPVLQAVSGQERMLSTGLEQLLERADHALTTATPNLPVSFTFTWQGIRFSGRVSEGDGRPTLRLLADLGVVPYSAENPAARRERLVLGEGRVALQRGRFGMLDGNRLTYFAEHPLDGPVNGSSIVTAATQVLLLSRPYLQAASASRH